MTAKFDYNEFVELADELISEFGFSFGEGVLIKKNAGTNFFDEGIVETRHNCSCIPLPLSDNGKKDIVNMFGSVAIHNYFQLIIGAKGLTVKVAVNDIIETTEESYKIVSLTATKPYKTDIMFMCYAEKL